MTAPGAHAAPRAPFAAHTLDEAAAALDCPPVVVARLLLRGRLAPAVLLPLDPLPFAVMRDAAHEVSRESAAVTSAVEDEQAEVLLTGAWGGPSAVATPRPDPAFAVRVGALRVIERELHLALSDGRRVAWPVDAHPAWAHIPTNALHWIALWGDAAVPTLVHGDVPHDPLPVALVLRSPATRLLGATDAGPLTADASEVTP